MILLICCLLLCLADEGPPSLGPGPAVPAEVLARIEQLTDPDWAVREAASEWLVSHPEHWAARIDLRWQPDDAEACWRWQGVLDTVCELGGFPGEIGVLPWDRLLGRARTLARRHPGGFRRALGEALAQPEARVRQRAIDLIAALPGIPGRQLLAGAELDPSPWVRRGLYRLALAEDRRWASELLERALARDESPLLMREAVQAMRWLPPDERLLRLLRSRWQGADTDLRCQIGLTLCAFGQPEDRAVYHWLLGTGELDLALGALGVLEREPSTVDASALLGLLESPLSELRREAMKLLPASLGTGQLPQLAALSESPSQELASFARSQIERIEAHASLGGPRSALSTGGVPAEPVPAIAPGSANSPHRPRKGN